MSRPQPEILAGFRLVLLLGHLGGTAQFLKRRTARGGRRGQPADHLRRLRMPIWRNSTWSAPHRVLQELPEIDAAVGGE